MDLWHELRIERTEYRRAIKRAYSVRLKEVHPEDDPAGFQRLRDAYERALAYLDGPQHIEPISEPSPPVLAPQPSPNKPKVPFRARVISHQRANRKAVSPIIMIGGPNRKLPDRNPRPPEGRPKLERFRRDFLNNSWPKKRRRMVGMLLVPYDLHVLEEERGRLSHWEQLHWYEDFATLVEELKAEYEASLDELGIDVRTADYWMAEPEVTYSKDLWRGSAVISATVTVVVMLAIAGARFADEMQLGPHPWWIEMAWVFGVIVTANRTWLSRRRRLWGLVCATLLVPPYTVLPELAAPGLLLAAVPLTAATSFPRATTYILMGMASGVYFVPIAWLGEALRWVLRAPVQHDPNDGLQGAFKPGLVWLIILCGFAGLIYDEPHTWTRVVFVSLWILATEGSMAGFRSDRVSVR
jgi:hypothetical protein